MPELLRFPPTWDRGMARWRHPTDVTPASLWQRAALPHTPWTKTAPRQSSIRYQASDPRDHRRCALNQKVTPALLSTAENTKKLELMIRAFFNRLEGYHVQYNVVDRATLIDAQKHPEKHRDLIVRVAGYSAFFNVLSRATQDDIIERTEQTI